MCEREDGKILMQNSIFFVEYKAKFDFITRDMWSFWLVLREADNALWKC